MECGGSRICQHGPIRSRCKDVEGQLSIGTGGSTLDARTVGSAYVSTSESAVSARSVEAAAFVSMGGSAVSARNAEEAASVSAGGGTVSAKSVEEAASISMSARDVEAAASVSTGRCNQCKECGGTGICHHVRQRGDCKLCGGNGMSAWATAQYMQRVWLY